jgi:hypothetical protein
MEISCIHIPVRKNENTTFHEIITLKAKERPVRVAKNIRNKFYKSHAKISFRKNFKTLFKDNNVGDKVNAEVHVKYMKSIS